MLLRHTGLVHKVQKYITQTASETSTLLWGKEKSTNKDLSDSEDRIGKIIYHSLDKRKY